MDGIYLYEFIIVPVIDLADELARLFYSRNGFKEGESQLCEHSGRPELMMHWQRD